MKSMWQLIVAAFCGGMCLPLSELMGMISHKEAVDLFFFAGMLIAGVIGVGGFFAAGAANTRSAFVAGVSAPQLLGGLAKAVPAGAKALSFVLAGQIAFAQVPQAGDSVKVLLTVEGVDSVRVRVGSKSVMIGDTARLTLRVGDSVVVGGFPLRSAAFVSHLNMKSVKVRVQASNSSKDNFLRGLFAQQASEPEQKKVVIEVGE